MDGVIEAVARTQNGVFTLHQARGAGATRSMVRHRVESGRWVQMHPGVFVLLGVPATPEVLVHAAVLASGSGAVASRETAAGLLGIPGFALAGRRIHVTTPMYDHRRRTRAHVHGCVRLLPHHCRVVSGVPCTSVARTLFDLCAAVRAKRAERALDNALARRMVAMPALWRVLDDLAERGRAGVVVLRQLLAERGGRYAAPESELETRFLELVRSHQLPEPARQVDLGDVDSWIGRVDFVYPAERIVIECDGALAHSALLDRRADEARDCRLAAAGWTVRRFTWTDVTVHPGRVAHSLRTALEDRAAA